MTEEMWRPVVGYEGLYEVSDLGRVRSLMYPTCHGARRRDLPKVLRVHRTAKPRVGHVRLVLCRDGAEKMFFVHRLVLAAFRGPCPAGMQAAHLDGQPAHNVLMNLEWVTPKVNHSHKLLHGTHRFGDTAPRRTLHGKDIPEIRRRRLNGETLAALAREFGVQRAALCKVMKGLRWKHIP